MASSDRKAASASHVAASPMASLTLSASSAKPTQKALVSPNAARNVPAVHACNMVHAAPPAPATQQFAHAVDRKVGRNLQRAHQQRLRHSLRPWRLPLIAAALGFHVARAAAKTIAPMLRHLRHRPVRPVDSSKVALGLVLGSGDNGGCSPSSAPGARKPALVWFRNDLRLHDHEPLAAACAAATSVLPVYVFDPREYGKSPNGFDKTGPYRARFILEALSDLRTKLRDVGSDLVLRIGKPEEVLPKIARAVGAGSVYCHGEVTAEETKVEAAVTQALDKAGATLKVMWGGTLFHVDDLPFQLAAMPAHYSEFRRAVKSLSVRAPVETPQQVKGFPLASVPAGELPSLEQLGFDKATLHRCASDRAAAGAQLRGGESEAMNRLAAFITHFTRAEGAAGAGERGTSSPSAEHPNFCCKVSPWLALGCLSPRQLYEQLQQKVSGQKQGEQLQAADQGSDTDMQWLLYELLWRDFFRFITKKYAASGLGQATQTSPSPATAALAMA